MSNLKVVSQGPAILISLLLGQLCLLLDCAQARGYLLSYLAHQHLQLLVVCFAVQLLAERIDISVISFGLEA
tara:strand:- start:1254 stop:1469 length:216 start_codon:yes stop_codon:yes gene_type:complete